MLKDMFLLKDKQDSHSLQASLSDEILKQFIVLAKIRAQEVFPTPLGPQNKNDCAKRLD